MCEILFKKSSRMKKTEEEVKETKPKRGKEKE